MGVLPAAPGAAGGARPRALALGALEATGLEGAVDLIRMALPRERGSLPTDAQIDVVLVDGGLEARDVASLVRSLHAGQAAPPLIVVGGIRKREVFLRALQDCGEDLVAVGVETAQLAAQVDRALRQALECAVRQQEAENLQLRRRLASMQDRMAEEFRIAASVQRSLLPPPFIHPRIEVAAEYIPMREIGGDHYDLVELDDGRVAVAIGDVMGKGVPAALLAMNLKAVVRGQLQAGIHDLGELVGRVNRLLLEVMPRGRFATFFFGLFDFESRRLRFVNAGHHHPFLLRRGGGVLDLVTGGTVLGLLEDTEYESEELELAADDLLVCYTDGVTDRCNRNGDFFGVERLKDCARRSRGDSARIALYSLLGELQGFSAGAAPDDDLTLLVARLR